MKDKTLENVYDSCVAEGFILPQEGKEISQIKATLGIVKEKIDSIKLHKKSSDYNILYRLNYDVLYILSGSLALFDEVKIDNHECLFAYLCLKHDDLELDWNFFELIRIKTQGNLITRDDYKAVEFQFSLYINTLQKELERKMNV